MEVFITLAGFDIIRWGVLSKKRADIYIFILCLTHHACVAISEEARLGQIMYGY